MTARHWAVPSGYVSNRLGDVVPALLVSDVRDELEQLLECPQLPRRSLLDRILAPALEVAFQAGVRAAMDRLGVEESR